MKYYFLKQKVNSRTIHFDDYKSNIQNLKIALIEGKSLKNDIEYINSIGDLKNVDFTDLIDTFIFTVSEKLKNKLVNLEDKLEFIPITINDNDETPHNYYAVNILNKLDALDDEKAKYRFNDFLGIVDYIEEFVLDENKIRGINIFREKHLPAYIIVSEDVKTDLVEFEDIDFIPVEEYKEPY